MAEFKTTVALEIGAQSVTMGVFTPAGKGYTLSRYARRDILLDPVEEGMRIDYVSNAIGEMVTELKVRGSDVRNVVSGQQVFMRFIKLPAIDIDDIAEHVGYEAQQHIPFPIEDIIYAYQPLPEREEGEQEILLVAIKKDVLNSLNDQVEDNGLRTIGVDCSISSLYNAYRLSYPEDETESVVLLDIGAKTTDIIFSENGRFFTRSVTAAGAYITNNIAREFNLGFKEAEKLKIESGMVSLGNGFTDNMTEQEAALSTSIRTAMSRLSSEILRTINHYRAQYKGSAPTKAYICGGGARLPYALEFLQGALNIPVEYLNPLNAFSVGAKVDTEALEMDCLCLGPIAGAAVTGAKVGEFNIDLVPTSVGKDRAEKEMLPKIVVGGLIACIGAGVFGYMANDALKQAEAVKAAYTAPIANVQSIAADVDEAEAAYQEQLAAFNELATLYRARTEYPALLKALAKGSASYNFWFTQIEPVYSEDTLTLTQYPASGDATKYKRIIAETPNGKGSIFTAPDTFEAPNALYIRGYAKDDGEVRKAYSKMSSKNANPAYFDHETAKSESLVQVIPTSEDNSSTTQMTSKYLKQFHMVLPLNSAPYQDATGSAESEDEEETTTTGYLAIPQYR